MSSILSGGSVGSPRERVDGPQKVLGQAPYAVEHAVAAPAYLHSVHSDIARGRIRSIDTSEAEAQEGVLAILTYENGPRLASDEDKEFWVLQSPEISSRGQYVAAVIAESPEIAREAAGQVRVEYDTDEHDSRFDPNSEKLYKPDHVNPQMETDTSEGDVEAAFAAAPMLIDQTYRTPMEHNNPMEPHGTTALWDGTTLTLYDSTQGVHPTREALSKVLGFEPDQVRMVAPYVGGGFGSKGTAHSNVVLAALAARSLEGRPVRYPVTRQQMYSVTGYRTPTVQRVRLGAQRDGRLIAIAHEVIEQTARIKEFAEQTAVCSRMMYQAPNRLTSHRLIPLDVPIPSWMRAPGECPGMFAPEVALDELAIACGVDPVELRIRNEPEIDPESKLPFSSRNLVACLREGAKRFGWSERDPTPGARRVGEWLFGTGVASSTYPVHLMPGSKARITRSADGRYLVEIGAADIGTGAWTALSQIAADALGVDFEHVHLEIGDTRLPKATVAGGSSGTNSWGTAIVHAAEAMRQRHGEDPATGAMAEGEGNPSKESERYAKHAFGAQFAEVKVNVHTGEIRVVRMLGIFAAGRIVNPRTARSQLIGGMTMGVGMGLMEESVLDTRTGHVVNHDLAEYHIPTNADLPEIEVDWIEEDDPHVNPMGTKGIGEIGIVGTAAALSNAAYHATGIRVRELPITSDKLLPS